MYHLSLIHIYRKRLPEAKQLFLLPARFHSHIQQAGLHSISQQKRLNMQFYNMAYIFLLLSSIYSPPFPHPHRYKHEQYGCCHKKQLIEIYLMWQFRFKKIPRKSNHNREWSCMTLSFAIPCQHIRINDIKNQRRNRWKRILKQQRCNRIHTADHQDVRQDIQDRILNKIQYVHSKS